ncbi:TrmB family transcriptional regulator [Halapricum hydrolyticum]|uniref:TrmB family transcriptional regulator n=1 Tax=Halapricum hydrolyticum TaxID=2979991 RepID=A0AAE3IA96_9EURY|nr:TrmB family transcriptional regulator sugar-binding domain-containing protein [Halapricum hydrolyticum]MCU4716972.1 TrmB family transcriptional regulator [Halapricum hydrolyticum]MCU4725423.1 TrmB family transcriptional regulator [Halapricum hydrolyticum]
MDTSTLTTVLEDAGLSPYQADAYVTILELGSASATDIAEKSDVPDPRIYDVLRDLEKHGYIETYEQDSLHARAYSPDSVLEDLRERADRFEQAADEIEDRWEAPTMDSHTVSFVKRMDTVLDKAETKIREAVNQVQVAADREQYERLRPALKAAHENGVHIRLALYLEEGESLPPKEELDSVATQVRYRAIPMPFIALVDRTSTCFAPHVLSANRYGIIVEDRTHAYVFHWFFMAGLWESTEPLVEDTDDSLPRTYVNIRQCIRDVWPLLEDGATLSVSVEGLEVESGSTVSFDGKIVDVSYPSLEAAGTDAPFLYLGGQATITIETDDGTVDVGGWGSVIEDYEATKIVLEGVTYE